jgi:hypothetical protein
MSGRATIDDETNQVSFPKRTKSTLAPFPELNREALSKSLDFIVSKIENGKPTEEFLKEGSFNSIYTFFLNKDRGISKKEQQVTDGYWVRYKKEDPDCFIDTPFLYK